MVLPAHALLAGAPVVAAWTPATAGAVEWWKADEPASIVSSGGLVSQWTGLVAGAVLTQAVSGNRPTTGTRTINGLNAFDHNGHWLTGAGVIPAHAQPHTVLMIIDVDVIANYHGVVAGGTWSFYEDVAYEANAGSFASFGASVTTGPQQLVLVLDGAASKLYKGGTLIGTTNPGTTSRDSTFTIGRDHGGSWNFDGGMLEVALIDGVISAGDLAAWNTYCARAGL